VNSIIRFLINLFSVRLESANEKKIFSIRGEKIRTDGTNDRTIGNDVVVIKNLNQPWAMISLASEEVRGAIQ